ncbi:MAG: aminopeptidase [Clostridiales bacterium]|jgi:aminopeptidase|nr:aminopeptidase [Clostridiales bacterium]
MRDSRLDKLADVLVNYSCRVQKGEKVLIEARNVGHELVCPLVEKIYEAGGMPFVNLYENRVTRTINMGMTEELAKTMARFDSMKMNEMDAYIGIRGGNNAFELSDVPSKQMAIFDKEYNHPVHHGIRVKKTKWVVLRYPHEGMAALAKTSTKAFEDFYFDVCTLDYAKMDKAMDSLCELINKTDKVRIVGKGTDISFSINGIGSEKCSGLRNIPDGEVYTAPVRDSVNGVISYNAPSVENGIEFKDVRFVFKNGKIIEATANNTDALNKILDTDEGARYIGEFAFGVNPYINHPMCDILFDEKISGSIHFTPGSCYDECNNGNQSAIHWDLVLIQTPEYGGGEIYFDGVLIRKDGRFVLPELKSLNPENLK